MHEKTGIPNVSIYHYKIMFRLLLGICTRTVREEPGLGDIYLRVELLRFSYCPRKNFSRVFSSMNTRVHHHRYMSLYTFTAAAFAPHDHHRRTSMKAGQVEYHWVRNLGYYYLSPTSLLGGLKPVLVFLVYTPLPTPLALRFLEKKNHPSACDAPATSVFHSAAGRSSTGIAFVTGCWHGGRGKKGFLRFPVTPILCPLSVCSHSLFMSPPTLSLSLSLNVSLFFFINLSSLFIF